MVENAEKRPESRKVEVAGLWVRATIATLLLAAAAVLTAYMMIVDDGRMDYAIERPTPSNLALIGDPAPPSVRTGIEDPRVADDGRSPYTPFEMTRSDASTSTSR